MSETPSTERLTATAAGRLLAPPGYSTPAEYVRQLERKGLLAPIAETETGERRPGKSARRYAAADVERLRLYLKKHRIKIGSVWFIKPGKGP